MVKGENVERNLYIHNNNPHAVQDHTSSFALYTVHFQFMNALMTADRRLTYAHQQTKNRTLQTEH
jgi:hypothetical protein